MMTHIRQFLETIFYIAQSYLYAVCSIAFVLYNDNSEVLHENVKYSNVTYRGPYSQTMQCMLFMNPYKYYITLVTLNPYT